MSDRYVAGAAAGEPDGTGADGDGGVAGEAMALLSGLAAAVGGGEKAAAHFYAHASDRMRGALGGETHFVRAFTNERFAPLAHGNAARLTEVRQVGDSARATLAVDAGAGTVTYIVAVARARFGERAGMWCLSGVAREGVDL
ncbi:MAG: hypothetical protein KF875_00535 [Trueperaceae bacterium]|nr:hypothetical protein [Trueperaceae bacterium]MCC6311924.1 hypothetical protein [Trueperaceae bacterium]MCW5819147.1 hypothetical protein [Trueperaceae bacterium]